MVEVEEIGVRCSNPECNQIQFLPFECLKCGRKFCIDHVNSGCHKCEVDMNEPNGINKNASKEENNAPVNCSLEKCSRVGIVCRKCGKTLCSVHIYESEHKCVEGSRTIKEGVRTIPNRYPGCELLKGSKLPEESKSSKMLRKIMIKSKSIGDSSIPARSRVAIALYVSCDVECLKYINKELPVCIWLNGEKTVGWNLDYISDRLKVLKGGGRSAKDRDRSTPNFFGLVLFKSKDVYGKDILEKRALDMSAELGRHVSDGESLLLDYGYI
ncbi:putative AN1-type zinc finger protein [Cryptosporidium canis]|uniref:AN1-type zinc finger protein n=1 Tax=Cryptosporidium canis TaxID=195482 RepID=A0ABQ8P7J8_9CRYT|nr:putative AN1-type zinc finger protein [Cryptosporidium canis]KAJ1615064.1 putative AN1-type zinc finger protein [Cryptosporidium canis]